MAELSDSSFVVIEYRHPSDSPISGSPAGTASPGGSQLELATLARAESAQVLQLQAVAGAGAGKGSHSTTDMLRSSATIAGRSVAGAAAGSGSDPALSHKTKSHELLSKCAQISNKGTRLSGPA